MTNKRKAKRWLNISGNNGHPIHLTVAADGASITLREKHSRRSCVINATVLQEWMLQREEDEAEAERITKLRENEAHHPTFAFMSELSPASPPCAAMAQAGNQSCGAAESASVPPSVGSSPENQHAA